MLSNDNKLNRKFDCHNSTKATPVLNTQKFNFTNDGKRQKNISKYLHAKKKDQKHFLKKNLQTATDLENIIPKSKNGDYFK